MISSMDLFFRRDCAGGAGPAVDAPRVAFEHPVLFDVLAVAACAGGCKVVGANMLDPGASVEDAGGPLVPDVTAGLSLGAVL